MTRIKLLSRPKGRSLPMILAAAVLMSTSPMVTGCSRGEDQPAAAPSTQAQPSIAATSVPVAPPPAAAAEPGPPPGGATPQELQELVSPIALYPDVLVAQILAGSTYPTQVVEADRWMKQNPNLTGDQLASQVNQQDWDPSIKSLTQFPSVLQTMNDSLSWTSALGEAYYNQPADVMNAIQVLRNKAMAAGNLKSTAQQQVEVQPAPPAAQGSAQPSVQQTVIIQPAQPNTVYVPQYNPTTAYGAPVPAPAGYTGSDLLLTGVLSFGAGILLGSLINNGSNNWGCNWYGGYGHSSSVKYNNNVYVTNNNVYPGRYPSGGGGYRPPAYRPPNGNYPRPGYPARPATLPATRPANGGGYNRPNNPAIPATRPYDKNTARPANPNVAKPNFPKASTLPNNPGGSNLNKKEVGKNRPNQPSNPVAGNQPANPAGANRPSTKPANRAADSARGFAKDNGSTGGRNSALGGYEPGGNTRAASDRGQSSFQGNQRPAGGRGNVGGGGNAKRAGGGGGGGGGGNRGGGKRGK
jgi:uncharacterized protein DUF3300